MATKKKTETKKPGAFDALAALHTALTAATVAASDLAKAEAPEIPTTLHEGDLGEYEVAEQPPRRRIDALAALITEEGHSVSVIPNVKRPDLMTLRIYRGSVEDSDALDGLAAKVSEAAEYVGVALMDPEKPITHVGNTYLFVNVTAATAAVPENPNDVERLRDHLAASLPGVGQTVEKNLRGLAGLVASLKSASAPLL